MTRAERHTTPSMSSRTPPQDIYARLLSSSRGYPLWTPEPSNELLMERSDGLRIGDVGVVLEDGGVDVLFNLCLPADHPFHLRHGVPQGFTCIHQSRLDIRTITNAEPPSYAIHSSSVTPVKTPGSSNDVSERHDSNALPYRFDLSTSEGAALVLPKGAERYDLLNEELFLEQASQHGAAWYDYAVNRRGRLISPDSLYLITGVHKTLAWSAAVFENASANVHHTAYLRQIERTNYPPTYSWETTGTCASEWRVAPDTGPHIEYSIPNQAVFIRGFKIAIRNGLLGTRWVSVEADSPSTRSKNVKLSSIVPSGSPILGRLAEFLDVFSSSGSTYFPTTTRSEGTIDVDEERPQTNPHRGGYDGTQVKIQRVPDVPRPFHPSDAINRYLLANDPSANIAITHDSHWFSLLENNSLTQEELGDECSIETALSQNYCIVSKDGVVYLERKSMQPTGSHPEQKATPAILAQSSPSHPLLFSDDVDPSLDGDNKRIPMPVSDDNPFEQFDPPILPNFRDGVVYMERKSTQLTGSRPEQKATPAILAQSSPSHPLLFSDDVDPSLDGDNKRISMPVSDDNPIEQFDPPILPNFWPLCRNTDTYSLLGMYSSPLLNYRESTGKRDALAQLLNELSCDTPVREPDILVHLDSLHAVRDIHDASHARCQWEGCGRVFISHESLTRHILGSHFHSSRFDTAIPHPGSPAPLIPQPRSTDPFRDISSDFRFLGSSPFQTNNPTESIDEDRKSREYHCGWITNGQLCDAFVHEEDMDVHLDSLHAIRGRNEAQSIACHWDGCGLLNTGSLARHIREHHLHSTSGSDTTIRHRAIPPLHPLLQPTRAPNLQFDVSRMNPFRINDSTKPIVDHSQHFCRWITNGLSCDTAVLWEGLSAHLASVHGVREAAKHLEHRRQSHHHPGPLLISRPRRLSPIPKKSPREPHIELKDTGIS